MSGFKPGSTLAPEPSTLTTEALNEAWKRGYKVAQEEAALASSAPASAPEPSEAIAQLRHLIDDLVVTYQEDGLDRHMVRDGAGLLFSNFVGAIRRLLASLPASPEPAAAPVVEPSAILHFIGSERGVGFDLTVEVEYPNLDALIEGAGDGDTLFLYATLPASPEPATQGAAEPKFNDVYYVRETLDAAISWMTRAWWALEGAIPPDLLSDVKAIMQQYSERFEEQRSAHRALAASPAPEPLTPAAGVSDEQIMKIHHESFEPMPGRKNSYMLNPIKFARAVLALPAEKQGD